MVKDIAVARRPKEIHHIRIIAPLYSLNSVSSHFLPKDIIGTQSHDSRPREVLCEELARPENTILGPRVISFPAQVMYEDDVDGGILVDCAGGWPDDVLR